MGHCKDCRWWTEYPWNKEKPDHRTYFSCDNQHVGSDNGDAGFSVYDDSLPIMPGPDFGCVHFEAKECV